MKDGCIKDKYDAKQTLLKSMIAEVSEERVCELWKITDSEVRLDFQLSLEVEYAANFWLSLEAEYASKDVYVDDKKSKDAGSTTLFATQLAVEHDSHGEIIGWLKKFINKHKKVQVNDNKENEPLQVENLLVS
ncbi:hypothetical protein RhiirA5_437819 [Rhizophagus irregularis]|uniref:Uncharacterized protein n=1 Tax=Rhizophagus irregularis TaxID=588596 RepID=A0A2I1FKR0_9GLOM|nr:hypothetical protein RhiirA5_437819 [Rhizophagus irregularis]PKC53568.1 hypothetical protein RhiirA1_479054 [Rhizophagus irregularis]PKY34959.1 hypothetical protein RhiirB3_455187 [Rhizophagus irregularis]